MEQRRQKEKECFSDSKVLGNFSIFQYSSREENFPKLKIPGRDGQFFIKSQETKNFFLRLKIFIQV